MKVIPKRNEVEIYMFHLQNEKRNKGIGSDTYFLMNLKQCKQHIEFDQSGQYWSFYYLNGKNIFKKCNNQYLPSKV